MTFKEIYDAIVSNPGLNTLLIIIVLSLIEICPLKINPWSWLGNKVGILLGVKAINENLDALKKTVGENQATTIRVRILTFEDRLQSGEHPSKDSWNQVMDDITRYKNYTDTHREFKNNITVTTIKHIEKEYARLLEERAWTTTLTNAS